ncbi:MAG: DUF4421 family protein [Cyclobacteriaceae bacterium]
MKPLCSRKFAAVVLFLLLGITSSVHCQRSYDSTYIQKFPDTLNLRVLLVQKGLHLSVRNNQQNQRFFFTPWHRNYVGVGGFLWNIGFNILVPVSPSLKGEEIDRFDFQGSIFARNWLFDGIYQNYQGFIQASNEFDPNADPDQYLRDTQIKKIQTTVTYLPSGKQFSLSFPFNQGMRQRKSGGSLLLSGDFSYKKIASESNILPDANLLVDDPVRKLTKVEAYSLTTMMGYSATLVYRNFFAHAFGLTGLGFQNVYYFEETEKRGFAIEPTYDIRGAIGYDCSRWYTGVYVSSDYTISDVEGWQFVSRTSQVRLYLGIRFTEPHFLRKIKPKFLKKLQNSPNIPLPFFG